MQALKHFQMAHDNEPQGRAAGECRKLKAEPSIERGVADAKPQKRVWRAGRPGSREDIEAPVIFRGARGPGPLHEAYCVLVELHEAFWYEA